MVNPLVEIKEQKNWTIQDFAVITNTSSSTIYKNLEGSMFEITGRILKTLETLGYDPEGISKEYQEFRKGRRKKLIS